MRDFVVLNTHWDNVSRASRERSAALVRDRSANLAGGLPRIVTGDLNESEDDAAVQTLLAAPPAGAGLVDGYRTLRPTPEANEATYHEFSGKTDGPRIDYILHDPAFVAISAAVDRSAFAGRYASDHFALSTTLAWKSHDAEPCP